jgi:CheY-like chemotaxis protein/anti-sigma regulatory factor (Ser/Thr protein kinase)
MRNVLLVDDSPIDRRLAARLLENTGHWNILVAEDGRQALNQLATDRVDVIITDMYMPNMDGLALLSAVKLAQLDTPVVLMTSRGSEEIAIEALTNGAASYVPKRRLNEILAATAARVADAAVIEQSQLGCLFSGIQRTSVSYCLENDAASFQAPLRYLRHAAQFVGGLSARRVQQICMAVEEALVNAQIHGNLEIDRRLIASNEVAARTMLDARLHESPYAERRIFLDVEIAPDRLQCTVRDEGAGFDVRLLPGPADREPFNDARGRGMMLLRTFFDTIRWNVSGNEVTVVKHLGARTTVG